MGDEEILKIESAAGSVPLRMYGIPLGEDFCIVLSGGDKPHIGAVILSQVRPSLKNDGANSSTSSVLSVLGHKEGEFFQKISEEAARIIGCGVVVCGGIHVDNASPRLIEAMCSEVWTMLKSLLDLYSRNRGKTG